MKLVNTIILNTKGEGQQSGEDFWVKAEKLYYTAIIGYIWYECVEEEQNFTTLLDMINASEAKQPLILSGLGMIKESGRVKELLNIVQK